MVAEAIKSAHWPVNRWFLNAKYQPMEKENPIIPPNWQMADPRLKQLRIKTGVVTRITKEKQSYEKETEREKERLLKLKHQGRLHIFVISWKFDLINFLFFFK